MSRAELLPTWFDHAQAALSHDPILTVNTIWALISQPDDGGAPPDGVTWWLEEARRVMLERARDRLPIGQGIPALRAWQARGERFDRRVESLVVAHAEAMQHAMNQPAEPVRPATPARRSATERALQARTRGDQS